MKLLMEIETVDGFYGFLQEQTNADDFWSRLYRGVPHPRV
jgi:hypothetical protein